MNNLLVVHGGGPTSVLNASLYGVIKSAMASEDIQHVYGALGGTRGFMDENFVDFTTISQERIENLKHTPGTAISTSRTPLYEKEYLRMVDVCMKYDIKYVVFNGGNGTMDACGNLNKYAADKGIYVMGIPKTVDNDLSETDHSPGYASMAKYMAISVSEVIQDVRSMPIHVSVIEAMGRNVGWITAASALATCDGLGPDMILLPEVPFDEDKFLARVKSLIDEKKGVVVVASEGLKDKEGQPIVPPIYRTDRATYYGDVGTYLAEMIIKKLGYKARSEKPGIFGRASARLQSEVDRDEAILVGEKAVEAMHQGISGKMVGLKRISNSPYHVEVIYIDIEKVMLHEKEMPDAYIDRENFNVTQEFIDYCKPLIGMELPNYTYFI